MDKFTKKADISNSLISYYIINKLFRHKVAIADTDSFNKLIGTSGNKILNQQIFTSNFIGISFKKVKKVKYVWTQGHEVPVEYIDYIPVKAKSNIIYSYVGNVDIDPSIINESLKISNGFISKVSRNSFDDNEYHEFAQLVKSLKEKKKK